MEVLVVAGVVYLVSQGNHTARTAARQLGRWVGNAAGSLRRVQAEVARVSARAQAAGGPQLQQATAELSGRLAQLRSIQAEAANLANITRMRPGDALRAAASGAASSAFTDEEIAQAMAGVASGSTMVAGLGHAGGLGDGIQAAGQSGVTTGHAASYVAKPAMSAPELPQGLVRGLPPSPVAPFSAASDTQSSLHQSAANPANSTCPASAAGAPTQLGYRANVGARAAPAGAAATTGATGSDVLVSCLHTEHLMGIVAQMDGSGSSGGGAGQRGGRSGSAAGQLR
jgi:hypothetical protein